MIHLPADATALNVALVYNLKKEDPTSDDSNGLPGHDESNTLALVTPSRQRLSDTYAEWDTIETIEAVRWALAELHQVSLIEANEDVFAKLSVLRPDIVFNIAEGLHGVSREAQIPSMLEFLRIPYTGSDAQTLATCLDKARTKEVLSYYGIPSPHFGVISKISELAGVSVKFPSIVKPLHEGSSKGIHSSSVVRNWDELWQQINSVIHTYGEPALVEEFLEGREFTVALLGNGEDVCVLPIVEIRFDSLPPGVNPVYSFEAKWIRDQRGAPLDIFECPANISTLLRQEIETLCRKAFRVLRCRDWCRIDVRLDADGIPNVLELNPLPGILPAPEEHSCLPKAALAAGMSYDQMIQNVLHIAAKRYGMFNGQLSAAQPGAA